MDDAKRWGVVLALLTTSGCSQLPPASLGSIDAPDAPAGAMALAGTGGASGFGSGGISGTLAPVLPLDGGSIDVPSEGDAGRPDAGIVSPRARPISGGQVPGPISGGVGPTVRELNASRLEDHGYVQEEFFLAGDATAYAAKGDLGIDGVWQTAIDGKAPFKTRLLVRRPVEASAFNGTVIVEWLNTTGGADAVVAFTFAREELLRGGYAYVGVSAQQMGVDALIGLDFARYASLVHPGDPFAYDIFAQAGAVIGWPSDVDPMGGLHVERLIAYGASQSATRMVTFANAVHPLTSVFDGFIIQSRAGWGAPIGLESDGLLGNGAPVRVRTDLDARVLQLFPETEMFLSLGPAFAARQPDSDRLRTWEIAGSAHADQFLLGDGADVGCGLVNDGPQHYVLKAAVRAMHLWSKDGTPPPSGRPLEVNAAQTALARDALGNALGGIRTPAIDVPIATLRGEPAPENAWNPACMLFGLTVPFTPEQLRALYPTHQDYVDKVTASARATREAGFILPEEEAFIIAEAIAAPIP